MPAGQILDRPDVRGVQPHRRRRAGLGRSIGARAEVAFSRLAAYPQLPQTATRSSPASDGHMNSIESLPPMVPLDASTAMAGIPSRAKIRS